MILDDTRALREYIGETLADEAVDADTELPRLGVYTPREHRRALLPDTTIVRGARGVGKTVWFHSLQDDELRAAAAAEYRLPVLESPLVRVGFGNLIRPDEYPSAADLRAMLQAAPARSLWQSVVLAVLNSPVLSESPGWVDRANFARSNPAAVAEELARIDRQLGTEGRTALILFDALDRMSASRQLTDALVEGLLQVALDLRIGTQNMRAKVFSRPDILESAHFTDASKLVSNRVDLTWSAASLFGLFFSALGNGSDPGADAFRQATPPWRQRPVDQKWRSDPLSTDTEAQARLFTRIAGPYMGSSIKRGRTYQWLPSHLADGRGEVSPRSFLTALREAAERSAAVRGSHDHALHRDELKEGVRFASSGRVTEVEEDMPWVPILVRPLEGAQVPLSRDDIFTRWADQGVLEDLSRRQGEPPRAGADSRVGPRDVLDQDAVLQQLVDVGVMNYRVDGRVDLPDVYRLAFGLGRKGGIPRVAAPN